MSQETQTGALHQPRGVGWGAGRDVQKGGDICTPMADSYWGFDRKQQNSIKQLSFNQKINKLKKIWLTHHCKIIILQFRKGESPWWWQWLRICLLTQRMRVWSLVGKGSTCHGVSEPVHHNYWSLCALEPLLCNRTGHHNESPHMATRE